jgi:hypothetical protein
VPDIFHLNRISMEKMRGEEISVGSIECDGAFSAAGKRNGCGIVV